ncbi:MAG: hypothetical protein K6G83_11380 [Lachnospiraceae bacterium]|nr:hypothetical protein [Lachnospiraceae bacterium]
MGQNIFSVLFSTIKSRFTSIVTKFRLWTSWNFIRTKVIGGIRDFFYKLLDIRPKNKDDYFTVFGWMISKRLAYAVLLVVGVLSFWYISSTTKLFSAFTENGGLRTYKYNSVLLRLAEGNVRITGKSGFLAYEGTVSKGYATGNGTLFSPDAITLYTGGFEKNMYEGNGTEFYDSGVMRYNGTFHKNLFDGAGVLYNEDGSREYEGSFTAGRKEGHGKLYNGGDQPVFDGSFSADTIVFSEFLGKDPTAVREMYFGKQVLYEDGSDASNIIMSMPDINAVYEAKSDGSAADPSVKVSAVIVLDNTFRLGEQEAKEAGQLEAILGAPVYEGNSLVTLPEAVAINLQNSRENAVKGKVGMDTTSVFTDDIIVNSFDSTYSVYVYTFERGDLVYTFICKDRGGRFYFYEIADAEKPNA